MSVSVSIEHCFIEAEETGKLQLSGRSLRDFPDVSEECELIDVIEADLSRNRLTEFPAELRDLVMLEKLYVYHNALRSIPDLSPLKALVCLNLRRNQINSIPPSLGSLPLKVLNLSNNKIASLPVEMGYLSSLQDLDLSSNELLQLPSSMGELISLKELNVKRNQLVSLPDELSKLKLVKLDFSCNKVSVIPPAYRLITTLTSLELSHNPLTSPPAQICIKGRVHIFKYLSMAAQQNEKRRTFDRDVIKNPNFRKTSSTSLRDDFLDDAISISDKLRRAHSLPTDTPPLGITQKQAQEKVYRPNSMREPRERARPPLSNMFEKRREIQKEIERAQQLLSESADHNVDAGSRQDSESNEGEELEREFLSIEMEERRKKAEEEERIVEERRRAAKKLQRDQQEVIQQRYETRRRGNSFETATNGVPERPSGKKPLTGSASYGGREKSDRAVPNGRNVSGRTPHRSNSIPDTDNALRQEEEQRAKKREALIQKNRREVQMSQKRLQEERLRTKQFEKEKPSSRTFGHNRDVGSAATARSAGSSVQDMTESSRDQWEEKAFPNIHKRQNIGHIRSLPRSFKPEPGDKKNFTVKRMYDSAREEFEQLEQLREAIESRLKVTLPDDLPAALADGVVLCHLVNNVKKGSIPSIHIPSAGVPKLTMMKCLKNVDSFIECCRKLGVEKEKLCSPADVLEEKCPRKVCVTVEALLQVAENS